MANQHHCCRCCRRALVTTQRLLRANLTVNSPRRLTVTKARRRRYWWWSGTGSVYTSRSVWQWGPTTAAINVSDVLPAGSAPTGDHGDGQDALAVRPAGRRRGLHGSLGHNGPVVIAVGGGECSGRR